MKPNFALSLTSDCIRLLLRAAGGWRLVGEVSLRSATFKSDLAVLRKTASALSPDGIRCKIVIPNQHVRYVSIDTPDMDMAQRRDMAAFALEESTPYSVDELAFDVSCDGDVSHVAAVAHTTLAEAEAFAEEHRFHPVCFVATPHENAYLGEPYFGPTKATRALLADGTTVEPDGIAIVVIGDLSIPDGPVAETDATEAVVPAKTKMTRARVRKSKGKASEEEKRIKLSDAMDSLRKAAPEMPSAAAPHNSIHRTNATSPTFASKRQRQLGTSDKPALRQRSPLIGGFAEPDPEPFTPKPKSVRIGSQLINPKPTKTFANEAERLTVFGERTKSSKGRGPSPLILALTAMVVVVSVGVGTFASGKLPDTIAGLFGGSDENAAELTAIQVAPPVLEPNPKTRDSSDKTAKEPNIVSLDPSLSDEDEAVLNALRAPLLKDDGQAQTTPQTPDDFRARYAVTGIWPLAPEVHHPAPQVDLEDLYIIDIDPVEPTNDAVALPQIEAVNRDIVIDAPSSPAAAGASPTPNDRDLVAGIAPGTIAADSTQPSTVDPTRPEEDIAAEATITSEETAASAFPKRVTVRPRLRPYDSGIVEKKEGALPDNPARSKLAEIRPPPRPARVTTADAGVASASLVPLENNARPLSEQNSTDANTRSVVTVRPIMRPSNLNQIVARSQKAAASSAASGAASIAPRTIVKPKIPSSASVTREATVSNAINLRKVNLIGVYGAPSQRRALVRLANGRYKKVKVGDRIDGGRISAIGEGELRYQKSGRNIVLKMPKS